MQTHDDREFSEFRRKWLESLEAKADKMRAAGQSKITGGDEGENPLAEWEHKGILCRHMPPDEHGILRISVGGGQDTPVEVNYCVFRGNRGHCIDLLRKALKAMESR